MSGFGLPDPFDELKTMAKDVAIFAVRITALSIVLWYIAS
jgi:hypothetical protein